MYGAGAPGHGRPRDGPTGGTAVPTAAVDAWVEDVRSAGVERVCCLLADAELRTYDDLLGRYAAAFGPDHTLHVPVPDEHLLERERLTGTVLPFLRGADSAGEPVVVHCRAGLGRTGHVLAAWLVHARGHDPREAVAALNRVGRLPRQAVEAGNATVVEVDSLLAAAST